MEGDNDSPVVGLVATEDCPPGPTRFVSLSKQNASIAVGRLESNQVVINDRKISKVHCRLTLRTCKKKGANEGEIMKRLFIKDSSTFGTFVNGTQLQKEQWTMLQDKDLIGLLPAKGATTAKGEYRVHYSVLEGGGGIPGAEATASTVAPPAQIPPANKKTNASSAPAPPATAPLPPEAQTPQAIAEELLARVAKMDGGGSVPDLSFASQAQADQALSPLSPSNQSAPQPAANVSAGIADLIGLGKPAEVSALRIDKPPAIDPRLAVAPTPRDKAPPTDPRLAQSQPTPKQPAPVPPAPLEPEKKETVEEALSPVSEGGYASEVSACDENEPVRLHSEPPPGAIPGMPGMTMPSLMPPIPGMPLPPGLPPLPGMFPPGMPLPPGFPPPPPGMFPPGMLPPGLRPGAPLILPGVGQPPLLAPAGSASKAPPKMPAVPKGPEPIIITVQEELVGMLIGRQGETVNTLQRDSGCKITIAKTQTDEDKGERKVFLSGAPENVEKAKELIQDTLSKAREKGPEKNIGPTSHIIRVGQEMVGMLIGRGGETIRDMKKESGARIDISKEAEGDSNDRMVHIAGPPECVECARKLVEDIINKAQNKLALGDQVPEVKQHTGPRKEMVLVPQELVGLIIGRQGDRINIISKESQARIEIAKENHEEHTDKRPVYLTGMPEQIEKAKELIDETTSQARERREPRRSLKDRSKSRSKSKSNSRSRSRSRKRSRSRSPPRKPKKPEQPTKILRVPKELVGMLIGKGGETINAISQDTGTRIAIGREALDETTDDRAVTISGSQEGVDEAADRCEEVLSKAKENRREYRRRSRSRSSRSGSRKSSRSRSRRTSRSRSRRSRSKSRGKGKRLALQDRRGVSPVKESYLKEKIYVDEVEMPFRPNMYPEHEDGLPTDLEIFVRNLPAACQERDLWEHVYRLGASDVKEILLLRRQTQSKGMAYIVFNRHDHAVIAKNKLNNSPASSLPCGGTLLPDEKGTVICRFSESERCINGRANAYGEDMVALILGQRGKNMTYIKEDSRLRKVHLTGRNMKTFGQIDEDPRLHLVVYYEPEEAENVSRAIELWGNQLGKIHRDIMDRIHDQSKGHGKGMGKFAPPPVNFPWRPPGMPGHPPGHPPLGGKGFPPPPGAMPFPPPPGAMPGVPPPMMPPPGIPAEDVFEAPVMFYRSRMAEENGELDQKKILEVTCLRGRELRWQPFPEVAAFNHEWKAVPIKWGPRGELFMILQNRENGEVRVAAAVANQPAERWPILSSSSKFGVLSKTAVYRAFSFNAHLFVISLDHETRILKVLNVPDPSSPWNVAFETTLTDGSSGAVEGFNISRGANLTVFYTQDRAPHVLVLEPQSGAPESPARIFRIVDPQKPWTLCQTMMLPTKVHLLPLYTKVKTSPHPDFNTSFAAINQLDGTMAIWHVFRESEKPWIKVSEVPVAKDTRLSTIYVPGKLEPLLMAGSPSERLQKLCHLNIIEWTACKMDERLPPPAAPAVLEKFSRPTHSLWPDKRDVPEAELVAWPIDCTADLPVSWHLWVMTPPQPADSALPPGVPPPGMQPGPPGVPPPGILPGAEQVMRPPMPPGPGFENGPRPPFNGHPPFDPRGPPPPGWDPRAPPPGFPARPPFDGHPPGAPPFPLERPPFDGPPGKGFDPHRPPFDGRPPGWFDGKGGPPPGVFPGGPPPGGPPGVFPGGPPPPPPQDGPPASSLSPHPPVPPGFPSPPFPGEPAGGWEAGTRVEANFRNRSWWYLATVKVRNPEGTYDLEFEGEMLEKGVPPFCMRGLLPAPNSTALPALTAAGEPGVQGAAPPEAPPSSAPIAPGQEVQADKGKDDEDKKRKKHKHHKEEDGEKKHRHKKDRSKSRDSSKGSKEGDEKKKKKHRHRKDKSKSPSADGEEKKKHRKHRKRHRSGEKDKKENDADGDAAPPA